MGARADLFGAIRGPDAEVYAAALDAADLGMADDFAPHGSCHKVPYVDARADGALARFQTCRMAFNAAFSMISTRYGVANTGGRMLSLKLLARWRGSTRNAYDPRVPIGICFME